MNTTSITVSQGYPLEAVELAEDGSRRRNRFAVIGWNADGEPIGVRLAPHHGPDSARPCLGPTRIAIPYVLRFPSVDVTGQIQAEVSGDLS